MFWSRCGGKFLNLYLYKLDIKMTLVVKFHAGDAKYGNIYIIIITGLFDLHK